MKFFVATPVYNGMPALRRCIGSVREQASSEFDVQHVIQDGESSDGTVEFLTEYVAQQPSIDNYQPAFASEADNGMYDAINKAWGKCDGDILSWLNSDEQYLPGTLQKVGEYFDAHPECDALFGSFIIVDEDGMPIASRRDNPVRRYYITNCFCYAASCTLFYRRRLWDSGLLKLDTQYRFSSDADLVLRLINAGVKFGQIQDHLALFSVVEGENLSFNPAMRTESEKIRNHYGRSQNALVRRCVRAMRHIEKIGRGCFKKTDVCYPFVLDESGTSKMVVRKKLGSRFTYDRFSRKEQQKKKQNYFK